MKKLHISLFPIILIVSGCAGMNSDFEFSKPAKDSGYWMQQADGMVGYDTNNSQKSTFTNNKLELLKYKLINLDEIILPVKFIDNKGKNKNLLNPADLSTNLLGFNKVPEPESPCAKNRCYQEASEPKITNNKIQRVWLAPYVSPDNSVHVGEIVYFFSEYSDWYGVE